MVQAAAIQHDIDRRSLGSLLTGVPAMYGEKLTLWLRKARIHAWIFYLGRAAQRAVVVQMIGGLGNQMFQYAAGRHLSRRFRAGLFLDVSWLSTPYARIKKRPRFHLDQYDIKGHILDPGTIIPVDCNDNTDGLIKDLIGSMKALSEQEYDLQDITRIEDVLYLKGYWQSEIYFSGSASQIKKEFVPRDTSRISALKKEIVAGNSVGIHVRRGDYLQYQDRFPVLPLSYYDTAVSEFRSNHKFYIFSDEPDWCRDHWRGQEFTIIEGNTPVEDLYLLSLCKNLIIANSSFSWWSAWLNDNQQKKIVVPMNWRGPGYEALKKGHHIIPHHWERVAYQSD